MAHAWPVMRTSRDVCSLRSSDNVVTDAWLALLVTFAMSYYISLMWSTVVGLLLVYCISLESEFLFGASSR